MPELTDEQRQNLIDWHRTSPDPEAPPPELPEWPSWPFAIERGQRLGLVLRYVDTETLAAIGTTEFVCAHDSEIREILGWTTEEDRKRELPSGAMLLIDLEPFRIRSVCAELPEPAPVVTEGTDVEVRGFWNAEQTEEAIANAREAASRFGRQPT